MRRAGGQRLGREPVWFAGGAWVFAEPDGSSTEVAGATRTRRPRVRPAFFAATARPRALRLSEDLVRALEDPRKGPALEEALRAALPAFSFGRRKGGARDVLLFAEPLPALALLACSPRLSLTGDTCRLSRVLTGS